MTSQLPDLNYQKIEFLGEGTYGIVTKAIDKRNNKIVAIKFIKLQDEDQGIPSTTLREISILKELQNHPNIVNLIEVMYNPSKFTLNLVFEYVEYDLRKFLSQKKKILTKEDVKFIIYQLMNGVDFCHSRRIIHRDLKPQNLLIDSQCNLKIADFGLARVFGIPIKTLTHQIQTLWYRAPQVLLGQCQYSLGVDIWAVGCIFFQLIQKKALFQGDSEIDQIFKIFQILGTPTLEQWPNINKLPHFKATFPKFKTTNLQDKFKKVTNLQLDLLKKMLKLDPLQRISMKQALKHQYFADLPQTLKKKCKKN